MNILITHFRSAPSKDLRRQRFLADPLDSAGTDGVSLEMSKRQGILTELGHRVAICSAYGWADYPVPALEFDSDRVPGRSDYRYKIR